MSSLACAATLIVTLSCAAVSGQVQSATKEAKEGTASISGRITIGTDPAPGVVIAVTHDDHRISQTPIAQATTDEDGRYKLKGLAAGRYLISPLDLLFVLPQDGARLNRGKSVNVGEGEAVEGMDLSLIRGAVITGRITDEQGLPLVGEQVVLGRVDEHNRKNFIYIEHRPMTEIDDRGIYRLFGLPAGRYVVGVGQRSGTLGSGNEGSFYARTFHPDVTDESQAKIIEVSPGAEATGIDITVGPLSRSYSATGRIVYAETGEPLANALYGYGILSEDGKRTQGATYSHSKRTDAEGNFRLEGILPGRYVVFSVAESESDYYGEPAPFEITDENVSGLEVRVHRGASISGVAVVEGVSDPDALAGISKLQLRVFQQEGGPSAPRSGGASVGPDGRFRIGGLPPGKVRLHLINNLPIHKGFRLLHVERGGVLANPLIKIEPGEEISDLRVIIGYGMSRIRGQLKMAQGDLPKGVVFVVTANLISKGVYLNLASAQTDERGSFVIEELPAGEYRLLVRPIPTAAALAIFPPRKSFIHDVAVSEGAEAQATITIALNADGK